MTTVFFSFGQDFTLNSQADVDAFDTSLTSISGDLTIETTLASDPIVDLSNLINLIEIGGYLDIRYNDALTNVDGFSSLTQVGGYLEIRINASLTSVDGFSNLTQVGGYLQIVNNGALTNIDGFSSLTQVGEYLLISSNFSLTNVDGFSSLTEIEGNLGISGNIILTNVDGFSNVITIGGYLWITNNDSLLNVDGFSSVIAIGEYLIIVDNDSLIDVDGFSNVITIGEYLWIKQSASLLNVDGFSSLTVIESLWIEDNEALLNVDGFSNLEIIEELLQIAENEALLNLDGFSSLTEVEYLYITENEILTNVDAFSNLSSIPLNLYIVENEALTNVDGFSNLTSISGSLNISFNSNLTNCCGIQNLLSTPNAIGGDINIYGNPSACSSESVILADLCKFIDIVLNPPCLNTDNGSIQLQVLNENMPPYTFNWLRIEDSQTGSGTFYAENYTIENLSEGNYQLTITDGDGDILLEEELVLIPILGSIFEIVELTTTNSSNGTSNGAIHLTVDGGTAPYNYQWLGVSSGNQGNISDNTFTIPLLTQGEYEIIVSDDSNNQQIIAITLLDETVPVFSCTQPLDIVILNDVSGSVDAVEYEESKQFFVDFINAINIGMGEEDSRAAIIEWSGSAEQNIQIPITGNLQNLQNYINSTRAYNGGTNPHEAMIFGENYLNDVARPDVARVLMLSTDGTGGQISPSLVALADEFKAAGYHMITVAFDNAFSSTYTRDILRQVASIDLLAPGAPAYSLLDQDLAENIVNLYLCPIDPGSSATVYFNRDGAINIIDIVPNDGCPNPSNVTLTFNIEALQQLSIPLGTPVTFYYNDPVLFGATPILTWQVPCAIPAGTIETFTVTLPVTAAANIFAIFNDDGNQSPPITLPITTIDELAYSNNIADITVCMEALPTLQTFKYTTTPIPICNNTVIYVVNVCNISDLDAQGVNIMDSEPTGFELQDIIVNDNNCAIENGAAYDIPAGCCVSLTYIYNASNAANGNYNNQGTNIEGSDNQIYLGYNGLSSSAENVLIDGTIDCPSTIINFTKEVNVTEICDDAFVVYTFTIDNQLNIPLNGITFSDVLPAPVNWVFEPYSLNGLSIADATLNGNAAQFIIDEIPANTVATFSMDASLGDWTVAGLLNNTASLSNVPDLANGILQTMTSNTVFTNVMTAPEIEITWNVDCTTIELLASPVGLTTGDWLWVTTGDGSFTNTDNASTIYELGNQDRLSEELFFSVTVNSDCGEVNKNLSIIMESPDSTSVNIEICEGTTLDYNGTILNIGDSEDFVLQNVEGCDSIVTVNVIGLVADTEILTYEICEGASYDYNGTLLNIGDSQDFTLSNWEGCDSTVNVTITASPALEYNYNNTTICSGDQNGFIEFVDYEDGKAPFLFSIDGVDYQESPMFENLSAGVYTIFVKDGDHCIFENEAEVAIHPSLNVNFEDESIPCGEEVKVEPQVLSYTDFYDYNLYDEAGSLQADALVYIPGNYMLEVTDICDTITQEIRIDFQGGSLSNFIYIPNVFSPNGDHNNDEFKAYFRNGLEVLSWEITLFDRWGSLVWQSQNIEDGWNGFLKGKKNQVSVYVWHYKAKVQICGHVYDLSEVGDVGLLR